MWRGHVTAILAGLFLAAVVAVTAGRGPWWIDLRLRNIASPPKASAPKKEKLNCSERAIRGLEASKAKMGRRGACERTAARREAAAKRPRPRG